MSVVSLNYNILPTFIFNINYLIAFIVPNLIWPWSTSIRWVDCRIRTVFSFYSELNSANSIVYALFAKSLLKWICIITTPLESVHYAADTVFVVFASCTQRINLICLESQECHEYHNSQMTMELFLHIFICKIF